MHEVVEGDVSTVAIPNTRRVSADVGNNDDAGALFISFSEDDDE